MPDQSGKPSPSPVDFKAMVRDTSPKITDIECTRISVGWRWEGIGFGELCLEYTPGNVGFVVDDEMMGKEATRKILYALADKIVESMKR